MGQKQKQRCPPVEIRGQTATEIAPGVWRYSGGGYVVSRIDPPPEEVESQWRAVEDLDLMTALEQMESLDRLYRAQLQEVLQIPSEHEQRDWPFLIETVASLVAATNEFMGINVLERVFERQRQRRESGGGG